MKEQRLLDSARIALGRMREQDFIHQFLLKEVVAAQANGWTLQEIGTNSDELRSIAQGYLMKSAGEALGTMRLVRASYSSLLGTLRGALAQCGKGVEFLGTTEDELRQLGEAHRQRDEQKRASAATVPAA
jgi:hypothetical protein